MPSRQSTIYPTPTTFVAALSPRATASSTELAQAIQSDVPSCAQQCLETYISQQYTCADDDASCLCTNYSSQGYALGELALICLDQDCSSPSPQQSSSAYSMCAGQTSAVIATHGTLTLPAPVTTSTSSSSPNSSASSAASSSASASTASSTDSLSQSSFSTITPPSTSTSTSAGSTTTNSGISLTTCSSVQGSAVCTVTAASATSSASASSNVSGLTGSEAVGITVGAIVAVIVAIAAVGLIIYLRRRRKSKQQSQPAKHGSWDFVDDASPRISSPIHNNDVPGGAICKPSSSARGPYSQQANRNSRWLPERVQSNQPHPAPAPSKTVAQDFPGSPESNCSVRTTSQLLPASLQPRGGQSPEHQVRSAMAATPTATTSAPVPDLLIPPPATMMQPRKAPKPPSAASKVSTLAPISEAEQIKHPLLFLSIPKQNYSSDSVPSLGAWPFPAGPQSPVFPPTSPTGRVSELEANPRPQHRPVSHARSEKATPTTSVVNFYAQASSPELYASHSPGHEFPTNEIPPPLPSPAPTPALRINKVSNVAAQMRLPVVTANATQNTTAPRQARRRPPPLRPQRPKRHQRPIPSSRHDSIASETSFESSTENDEPSPPERTVVPRGPANGVSTGSSNRIEYIKNGTQQATLTDELQDQGVGLGVSGSTSPIADVRYPQVPRPSNQAPSWLTKTEVHFQQPPQQQQREGLQQARTMNYSSEPRTSSRAAAKTSPARATPPPATSRSPATSVLRRGSTTSVLRQKELRPLQLQQLHSSSSSHQLGSMEPTMRASPGSSSYHSRPAVARTPSPRAAHQEMLAKSGSRSPLLGREVRIGDSTAPSWGTSWSQSSAANSTPSRHPTMPGSDFMVGASRPYERREQDQVIHIRLGDGAAYL